MSVVTAVAQRAFPGQSVCGDAVLVRAGPVSVVVVADGLGHGEAAAEAAQTFIKWVEANVERQPSVVLQTANDALAHTRGAAAMVAQFNGAEHRLTVAGVGNIELRSNSRRPVSAVSTPGIIGRPVRKVMQFDYPLTPGDLFAMMSDGIATRFALSQYASLPMEQAAERILADHGKSTDDATCVLVRYRPQGT